ncbi:MAG: CHAT domain-containing protein [Blastocatellia bacterium]
MNDVCILVAEDDQRWQEKILKKLKNLTDNVKAVGSYDEALSLVKNCRIDLAIIDLHLPTQSEVSAPPGMDLLREIRGSDFNQHCAVIIISGHATINLTVKAQRDYGVFEVIEKGDTSVLTDNFVSTARSAILKSRINKASSKDSAKYQLRVRFNQSHLLGSELTAFGKLPLQSSLATQIIDVEDLVRRADLLNWMIEKGGPDIWRPEARSVGNAIYETIAAERNFLLNLNAARLLAKLHDDVWLQFSGPSVVLGTPFELMRDGEGEPLVLSHIMTRQMTPLGGAVSHKPEAFYTFIQGLQENLRVLIVGANSDGQIPAAEIEAKQLEESIKADLQLLGIPHEVKCLTHDSDYDSVKRSLRNGNYHIFHYAGHGHYDEDLAESSGFVLKNGNDKKIITANEIYSLARNSNLRMVFLSSCTSAQTAERVGRGDFHSVFEALAKADVPIVIGYRWAVADRPAMRLAEVFYHELWRTLSPGEALLRARQNAAQGDFGRDDDTWASPVMLMQNV